MAIGDVYKAAVVGAGAVAGQTGVMTFHYRQLPGLLSTDGSQELADSLEYALTQVAPTVISVSGQLNLIQVRRLVEPQTGVDSPVAIPGTSTGDMLPPQVAAVVSWRTGFIGRSRRGRVYIPFQPEAGQNFGVWSTPYQAALQTFGNGLLTLYDTVTHLVPWFELVVYSTISNGQPRPVPLVTTVTTAVVNGIARTQRRRVLGVGQ